MTSKKSEVEMSLFEARFTLLEAATSRVHGRPWVQGFLVVQHLSVNNSARIFHG